MNKYAGKVRIGVIAILGVAALAIAGLHHLSGRAYSQTPPAALFVTDGCSDAVTAYAAASTGDASPLPPTPTGLSEPDFVAVDPSGNIYATNRCTHTVTIYTEGSHANAAPIAIIGGSNTGLQSPVGIALDSSRNIYVADQGPPSGAPSVFVYPPLGSSTGTLNEFPTATINGTATGMDFPQGIALDSSGNIYVADFGDPEHIPVTPANVFVYPPLGSSTGTLDEAPTATITGTTTDLNNPTGIALDSSRNIYVTDSAADSVFVYPPLGSSTGKLNESPTATISGIITTLNKPWGIALDSSSNIYVVDQAKSSLTVYPPLGSSTGTLDEKPTATISGSSTGLNQPWGIALDSSADIYVANDTPASVLVYPPLGSSTGPLNEAPSAAISASITTGLFDPYGIAVDISGNIYVTNDTPPSVFVYPVGSNANAAATASISGTATGLESPTGIAVDSSGSIYVADFGDPVVVPAIPASVFVYPPLASLPSQPGYPNVAPVATISGSKTDIAFPIGIAVDSSGKIYVAGSNANNSYAASVFVFPPLGSSSGLLNEAPIAIISGGATGLVSPAGITVDFSDNIYVTDLTAMSVFVFPPVGSSTGTLDEKPTATISGISTALNRPFGIALDSSGNIYVANQSEEGDSVFVYPPLGSSTGLLDEPPSATISGPLTELGDPLRIALQPGATPTPTASATATTTATATKTATATATPTATVTPTTTLSAAPTTINFGIVDATGTSKAKKVTLTNKGPNTAVIGSVTATAPFAIASVGNTCSGKSVAVKKKCSFEVEFSPATPNAVTGGSIEVSYNGTSPAVSLSGIGVQVTLKAPSKETFSPVAAGGTGKSKAIKISNPATVSVSLGTTSIDGTDPTAFTKPANTCTGTLAAKPGSCTITMEFTPKSGATGAQSATLGFSYTYGVNTGKVSIPISGTVK